MLNKINKVVKIFVLSDFLLFMGWGLISPIFSIFVLEQIEGATLVTVGIGTAAYWFFRSVIQPPTAYFLDKHKGEKDDLYSLIIALVLVGLASFELARTVTEVQLYLVQSVHGAAFGVYSVAWPAIFSRHMDKDMVAVDWSLDRSSVGMSVAVTSILGATVAEAMGFPTVFVLAGTMTILSGLVLLFAPKWVLPHEKSKEKVEPLRSRVERKHKYKTTTGL